MRDFEERPRFVGEEGESPLLKCPRCSGVHVAPRTFVVRHRDREDAPGLVVAVREHAISVRHTEVERDDGRRDSVDITFGCEECGESSVLQLREDRGRTVVEWVGQAPPRASSPT